MGGPAITPAPEQEATQITGNDVFTTEHQAEKDSVVEVFEQLATDMKAATTYQQAKDAFAKSAVAASKIVETGFHDILSSLETTVEGVKELMEEGHSGPTADEGAEDVAHV